MSASSSSFSTRSGRLLIGQRLYLGFGIVLAMMLCIIVVSLTRIVSVTNTTHHIIEVEWVKSEDANTLSNMAQANARRTVQQLISTPQEIQQLRSEILAGREAFVEAFKRLQAMVDMPEAKQLLQKAEVARQGYVDSQARFYQLVDSGQREEATQELTRSTLPQLALLQQYSAELAVLEKRLAVQAANEAVAQADVARWWVLLLGAGAMALGMVLAWWITQSITNPLSRAVRVARAVAKGDLSSRIEVNGRDETAQLLEALREMNQSLSGIVREVRMGSDAIATATSQIAAGNLDLSSRTEEQASALEETTASMQELSSAVTQNFHSGKQAADLAESASQVAVRGGAVVGDVVHTMEAINHSSRKIADIIGIIDGIAFQTNILALNAAVEAARAGEQGRGFAVVASEVRSLAQRSAEAAKEIKGLITESVSNVSNGCTLVEKAGSTMDEIVVSVRRVADIMNEISLASQDQSTGISQINEAMTQMDQVTQSNAALVEEAAAAAQSLELQAQSLVRAVSVFHLDAGDAPVLALRAEPSEQEEQRHGVLSMG